MHESVHQAAGYASASHSKSFSKKRRTLQHIDNSGFASLTQSIDEASSHDATDPNQNESNSISQKLK